MADLLSNKVHEGTKFVLPESIDTVHLVWGPGDFKVAKEAELIVEQGRYNSRTGELTGEGLLCFRGNDEPVFGRSAYMVGMEGSVFNKIQGGYLRCHFEIPEVLGRPFCENGKVDYRQALEVIQERFGRVGITLDAGAGMITRVDTASDVWMEKPLREYSRIFPLLGMKRARDRKSLDSWHLLSNSSEAVCLYDKTEQLRYRGIPILGNLTRFEHRILRSYKVKSALGFHKAGEVLRNWDDLVDRFARKRAEVFSLELSQEESMDLLDIEGLMDHYETTRGRFWKQRLRNDYSYAQMVQVAGLDAVLQAFDRRIPYSKGRARIRREIADAVSNFEDLENRQSLAVLYQELRAHFVAA